MYGAAAALIFPRLFFTNLDPAIGSILSYVTFFAGFAARPVGAALFGHWGDTLGRRSALVWSVILMAIPTFGIGLLPTYEIVGLLAPFALTCCRFLQGLSVGGEFTGSATFLVEHAAPSQRGYIGSWAGFSAQVGALLGSGVGALVADVDTGRDAVVVLRDRADRIRECAAGDCQVIYLDTSRSGNRTWCSMQRCGNRHKVRQRRARDDRLPVEGQRMTKIVARIDAGRREHVDGQPKAAGRLVHV